MSWETDIGELRTKVKNASKQMDEAFEKQGLNRIPDAYLVKLGIDQLLSMFDLQLAEIIIKNK